MTLILPSQYCSGCCYNQLFTETLEQRGSHHRHPYYDHGDPAGRDPAGFDPCDPAALLALRPPPSPLLPLSRLSPEPPQPQSQSQPQQAPPSPPPPWLRAALCYNGDRERLNVAVYECQGVEVRDWTSQPMLASLGAHSLSVATLAVVSDGRRSTFGLL